MRAMLSQWSPAAARELHNRTDRTRPADTLPHRICLRRLRLNGVESHVLICPAARAQIPTGTTSVSFNGFCDGATVTYRDLPAVPGGRGARSKRTAGGDARGLAAASGLASGPEHLSRSLALIVKRCCPGSGKFDGSRPREIAVDQSGGHRLRLC